MVVFLFIIIFIIRDIASIPLLYTYGLFIISLLNLYILFMKYYVSSIGIDTIRIISLRVYTISAWYCNFFKQVIDYEKYTYMNLIKQPINQCYSSVNLRRMAYCNGSIIKKGKNKSSKVWHTSL